MKLKHCKWIVAVLFIVNTPLFSANNENKNEKKTVIESFHVQSDIRYRFATTQMVSVVRNKDNVSREIDFDVTLPEEAFISHFSMLIDNETYDGTVKEKLAAQQDYQKEVNRGQSAAIVQDQFPRNANTFSVSVNVKAGTAVTFTLVYQELLRRKNGVYEHEIHAKPGQGVEDFLIEIYIQEKERLTVVNKPVLKTDSLLNSISEVGGDLIVVDRPTPETAHIVYRPSQAEQGDKGISAKFTVQYDVEHKPGGEILMVDGYFIHFFAPSLPPIPKDIIFVVDVSGSMYGSKLDQLKNAMTVILNDLQPQDRFNLIKFSDVVIKWKSELVSVETKTIQEAQQFVQDLIAGGLTNLNDALVTAVKDINLGKSTSRVGMIFFLTDGEPTYSEMDPVKIAANVARANTLKVSIYGLAFGFRADFDLLKKISLQNFGFARKIYEASDAALQVTGLYRELSAVSMLDANITYLPGGVEKSSLTESHFPMIFAGSEVAVSGKLANSSNSLEILIEGIHSSGNVSIILPSYEFNNNIQLENPFFTLPRDYSHIVERIWAFLTVKQMLKDKERNLTKVSVKELESRIIEMSIKYKFVTALTAMIVKKPEAKDNTVSIVSDGTVPLVPLLKDRQSISLASYLNPHSVAAFPPSNSLNSGDPPFLAYPSADAIYGPDPQYWGTPSRALPSKIRHHASASRTALKSSSSKGFVFDEFKDVDSHRVLVTPALRPFIKYSSQKKSRKDRKRGSVIRTFTDNPLPVFTVVSGNLSLCILPKRLQLGTYRLLKTQNSTFFDLGFVCNKKTCPALPDGNVLTGANHVAFFLVNKDVLGWKLAAGSAFSVNTTEDELNISGEGIKLKVNWKYQGGSKVYKLYTLEMTLDPRQKYSGLVGDLLNLSAREHKKMGYNVPSVCKGYNLSKTIKTRMAKKYLTPA